MYLELGEREWFWTVEIISSYFFHRHDRGSMLTPAPEELKLKPVTLINCFEFAPLESKVLGDCKTRHRLVRKIDDLLRAHRHLLDHAWAQKLPLEGVLYDSREDLFTIAVAFLRTADRVAAGTDAAVISLIAYALIGLGVRRRKCVDSYSGCRICWFRNCVPGSKYCFFHQYSHRPKGQANRYAQRQRAKRTKRLYPERDAVLRRRFQYYLTLLNVPREGWAPIFEANVVSEMSVKWLREILLDCPNVRDLVLDAIDPHMARGEWREVFNELRLRIDPYDTKTNLDFWCAKLVEAEAWLGLEREISGQWVSRDVLGNNGHILRSGQHVGGIRGPKQSTRRSMKRAIEIAMQGGSRKTIANDLAVSLRTLCQWEKRHLEFRTTLNFYLKRKMAKGIHRAPSVLV